MPHRLNRSLPPRPPALLGATALALLTACNNSSVGGAGGMAPSATTSSVGGSTAESSTSGNGGAGGGTASSASSAGGGAASSTSSAGGSAASSTSSAGGGGGSSSASASSSAASSSASGTGGGACDAANATVVCDDQNPCTSEACSLGACAHTITPGLACGGSKRCSNAGVCSPLWSRSFGGPTAGLGSLALDGADNEVILGTYGGTIDFGGGPLPIPMPSQTRVFVAKFDPGGGSLWSKSYGSTGRLDLAQVCADAAGNTVLAGYFNGTSELGSGPTVFVAKLDPAGQLAWLKTWAPTSASASLTVVSSVAVHAHVDAAGNILVDGALTYTDAAKQNFAAVPLSDFGGPPLGAPASTALVKLDPTGNLVWSKGLSAADGLPYAGPATFVDGAGDVFFFSAWNPALQLRKRNPDGSAGWTQVFPFQSDVYASAGFAANGEIVVTGSVPEDSQVFPVIAGKAIFTRLDPQGQTLWSKTFAPLALCPDPAPQQLKVSRPAVGPAGEIFFDGTYYGSCTMDFGAGPIVAGHFIARLDAAGNALWSRRVGANSFWGGSFAANSAGSLLGAGFFSSTSIDFGSGALSSPVQGNAATSKDFLANLGP